MALFTALLAANLSGYIERNFVWHLDTVLALFSGLFLAHALDVFACLSLFSS
jgi:hypothetical protein